ncbi:MAG: type II toxin-antitoxin system RelE family toxin [Bradymonadaceae bacterium]
MSYKIELTKAAGRELKKLERGIRDRLVGAIDNLGDNPRPTGVTKLSGEENLWRIRVGNYRVVYSILDDRLIVIVIRVRHRKDAY